MKTAGRSRAFAFAATLFLALLAGCSRTPPEQALRDAIDTLETAIESRDAGAVGDLLAQDFIGPEGMDHDAARRMAMGVFLRYRDVGVTLGPLQVDLQGEQATVRCTATLTGGAGLLPQSGQVYDVQTQWRVEGGEWRLVNAEWTSKL